MNSLKIMIFLFLISIFSTAQIPKTLENKNRNIRNLQELSDDIAIIHVNDVHCGLNETIGYDGFVLYRNELKKKYKYVINSRCWRSCSRGNTRFYITWYGNN